MSVGGNSCDVSICGLLMTDYVFPKMLDRPEMLCALSSLAIEATGGELKTLLGLMVMCNYM